MLPQVFAAEQALHCSRSGATQLHRCNLGLGQQLVHEQQQLQATRTQLAATNEALTRANNRTNGLRTRNSQLQSETAALRQRLKAAERMLATVDESEQGRDEGTSAAPELQLDDAPHEDLLAQAQTPPPQTPLADSGETDSSSATAQRDEAALSGEEAKPSSPSPVVSSPDDASGEQAAMEQASAVASPASENSQEVDTGRATDLQARAHDAVSATQSSTGEGSQPAARSPAAELHPFDGSGEAALVDLNTPQSPLLQSADGQPAADGEPVEASSSANSNLQALEQAPESTAGNGVALTKEGTDAQLQLQHGAGARRRRRRPYEDEQQCSSVTARSREADPRWACCGWLQATMSMAHVMRRRCSSTTANGHR